MEEQYITIPANRYVELIRAEQTARMMQDIIQEAIDNYHGFDRAELRLLHTLFCGYVPEEEEA